MPERSDATSRDRAWAWIEAQWENVKRDAPDMPTDAYDDALARATANPGRVEVLHELALVAVTAAKRCATVRGTEFDDTLSGLYREIGADLATLDQDSALAREIVTANWTAGGFGLLKPDSPYGDALYRAAVYQATAVLVCLEIGWIIGVANSQWADARDVTYEAAAVELRRQIEEMGA
jgi:hypothetical protein